MRKLPDGTVVSHNIQKIKPKYNDLANSMYKAIITKINYANDKNFMVTYEIEYLTGLLKGTKHPNVVDITSQLSGPFNFFETIRTPAIKTIDNKLPTDNDKKLEVGVGDIVFIAFENNDIEYPMIIGCLHSILFKKAAKEEDGIRLLSEFNGIEYNINKDGELVVTYLGGQRTLPEQNDLFQTERPDTAPTSLTFDKTGAFILEDKENQMFKMDRENKKLLIEQYTEIKPNEGQDDDTEPKLINSLELDKENKKITSLVRDPDEDKDVISNTYDGTNKKATKVIGLESEVTEEIDGNTEKMTVTFKTGLVVEIDGANDKMSIVTTGGAKIDIDGNTNKVIVEGVTIELGEGAIEQAVLGTSFQTLFNAHVHPTGMGPSGPATPQMLPSHLSNTVKVKA